MAEGLFEGHEEFSGSQDIELDVDQKTFAQIENLHAPPGSVALQSLSLCKNKAFEFNILNFCYRSTVPAMKGSTITFRQLSWK